MHLLTDLVQLITGTGNENIQTFMWAKKCIFLITN